MKNTTFFPALLIGFCGCADRLYLTGTSSCNERGLCSGAWPGADSCGPDWRCYIPCSEDEPCPDEGMFCHTDGRCYEDWVSTCNNEIPCPGEFDICWPHDICFDERITPLSEDKDTVFLCSNGIDEDEDGYTDCDDQDCWSVTVCADHTAHPDAEEEPDTLEDSLEECLNDVDDDNDGRIDCAERACAVYVFCEDAESENGSPSGPE